MRRRDREITEFWRMVEILDACDIAHVAMVDDAGEAYVVPVNFGFSIGNDTVTVYFHGAKEGKKAEILSKQGPVTVCIDRGLGMKIGEKACDFGVAYESVMLFGRVSVLDEQTDKRKAFSTMLGKATEDELAFDEIMLTKTAVYAVEAQRWTAKECPLK